MATYDQVEPQCVFMGRLSYGADLLEELTKVCREHRVCLGRVQAIGAVQSATIGFYDQATHTYRFKEILKPMEITQLSGNISLKDGEPFVHAHVSLADEQGNLCGGHLGSGTTVFAGEFVLEVFAGPEFERQLDAQTGLPLWKME